MQTKTIIFSTLSIFFILSGCSFLNREKPQLQTNKSTDDGWIETSTNEDLLNAKLDYGIIFPIPYTIEMYPGESKTENIEIKNTGLNADTFVFEGEVRRGEETWIDFSPLPEPTYLKSGKKMTLTFSISVPEDAEIDSRMSTTVRTRRQINNEIIGSTDIGIKVVEK